MPETDLDKPLAALGRGQFRLWYNPGRRARVRGVS